MEIKKNFNQLHVPENEKQNKGMGNAIMALVKWKNELIFMQKQLLYNGILQK